MQEPEQATDGEIPLLDADRLDDFSSLAASDGGGGEEGSFGDAADTRAIRHLIERLRRTPANRRLSSEQLEDRAILLYNRACDALRANPSSEQLQRTAAIFGEDPGQLLERLGVDE